VFTDKLQDDCLCRPENIIGKSCGRFNTFAIFSRVTTADYILSHDNGIQGPD
jgi:hypothetical protein